MNYLNGLSYDSGTYLWLKTFEELERFVLEALNLKGKWKSPGGDVKVFKSEGEGEYMIKWRGPRSKKLVIQSDDAEENLKLKFESLINRDPKDVNPSCEASTKEVCSSVNELTEPSVSQFDGLKADIATLVDITSDLITEINSMRSKQKDFESVIRKQDSEICRLSEANLLLASSLLSLGNSTFKVMNINPMTNSPTNSMKITTFNDPTTTDKDPLIDPNIYTSHTIGPTSFNEFNIYDEFRNIASDRPSVLNSDLNQSTEDIINIFHNETDIHNESVLIVKDQPSVSNTDLVKSCTLTEATNLNKASKTKSTTGEFNTSTSRLGNGRFNRATPKRPKHLTPCPFLRKRKFCKKGNNCDFLHQKPQFYNNIQRPSYKIMDKAVSSPSFHYSPFPVNPYYFPPFRSPIYHPTSQPFPYPPPLMSVQTTGY
jgi:hypothetical protein